MIYLDNSATSFPKPRGMTMEMEDCILNYCGNPGRSGHYMSIRTGEAVYEARKSIASFFNIKNPERLVFTKNTTEAINIGMKGFLKNGDHVITTSMEHNSVLRPLKFLEENGVTHTIVKADRQGNISPALIKDAIRDNTRLIVMTGASNVTGTIMPVEKVGKIAADNKIAFMLDGAQTAGCRTIDVEKNRITMLAFPGHKGLLGPLGTGGLYVDDCLDICPLIHGGTGTESKSRMSPKDFPEGFEAGTLNAPAIIGLGYSTSFVSRIGTEAVGFYERQLISRFDDELSNMEFIERYGPEADRKVGISLFNIRGMESEEVTARLNREYGIAVRGGFHCAGPAHKTIGSWENGAVRVSVGPFNSGADITKTIDAIWRIGKSTVDC